MQGNGPAVLRVRMDGGYKARVPGPKLSAPYKFSMRTRTLNRHSPSTPCFISLSLSVSVSLPCLPPSSLLSPSSSNSSCSPFPPRVTRPAVAMSIGYEDSHLGTWTTIAVPGITSQSACPAPRWNGRLALEPEHGRAHRARSKSARIRPESTVLRLRLSSEYGPRKCKSESCVLFVLTDELMMCRVQHGNISH